MVALVAALFACVQASQGIGGNAADALFFLRFGVNYLPYLFMALGTMTFFVTIAFTNGLGRFEMGRYFGVLFLGIVVILLVERAAISLDPLALGVGKRASLLYPLVWLSINVISAMLGIMIWNVAGVVCNTRQAKRLFSIFASAGILGGMVGNLVTGPLAHAIGTENLLVLTGALLLVSLWLLRSIARQFFGPKRPRVLSLLEDIRASLTVARGSRLIRYIIYASILFSILFFSMSFPFSQVVSASFDTEAGVAGFLGLFSSMVTGITLIASLLMANRLYARIGIGNSVLLLPIMYLAGFILWLVKFNLATAVIARLAQMVVLGGVANTAWLAFFNVIPPEKRDQVQAFEWGVPSQIGIVLAGVLIIASQQVPDRTPLFLVGGTAALLTSYFVWQLRNDYGASLVEALRSGYTDVFTGAQKGFQTLGTNAGARRTALAGLGDGKPAVRRASAEILGKLGATEAVEPLRQALEDTDAQVRCAAIEALVQLGARESVDAISAHLRDADPDTRASAVNALAVLDPESIHKLHIILDDASPIVRARAALAMHRAGHKEHAHAAINALLGSSEPQARMEGLLSLSEYKDGIGPARIAEFLNDDTVGVRVAAVHALKGRNDSASQAALVQALDDADARVRNAAGTALGSAEDILQIVTRVLNQGSERAQDAALFALEGRGAMARDTLAIWSLIQIPKASEFRAFATTLASVGDKNSHAVTFLRDLLLEREWQVEQRVLKALALIGTPEAIRLIAQALKSRNPDTRAKALEALDTLGDKRIARALIPLLEENVPDAASDVSLVLQRLSFHADPWIRAIAVHAIGDQLTRDLRTLADRAHDDPEPIVRQAAADAMRGSPLHIGGTMPETPQMLGTMDRILFLRQVPIFSNLAPEDLARIAEIATERLFPPGEYLCREGELGEELFVIVEGQVSVAKETNGTRRTLRVLQTGEQIGELAILREQPRSASVIAEGGNVRALVLCGDAMQAILRDRPEVALAMLASLAQRLGTA